MEVQLEHEEAFPRLAGRTLALVEAAGERRRVATGEVLHQAGEIGREFYVVAQGSLAAYEDYGSPVGRTS